MGETHGRRGVWAYVRGGMGALSESIAAAARGLGVRIECDAEVSRIDVHNDRATGVTLSDGRTFAADAIVSNADMHVTFRRLMNDRHLPDAFRAGLDRIDYRSASMKINCLLDALPEFTARPDTGAAGRGATDHLRGTIHIAPSTEFIERACDDARYGRPSQRPVLECTLASVVDETLAPPGMHLMSMFVQYAPYELRDEHGRPADWNDHKDAFADRCIDLLAEYAPNVKSAVIDRQVLSPVDIERTFGLTGGNIFQGAMSLGRLFSFRPMAGYADHRTPIRGLYLCGAATHPGGGVMGACGRNAAREILRDV
jgi:phytoene dehydrogenase-like protein